MARTWALMIGLAVLCGSVCTGQDVYTTAAASGIELTGLVPIENYSLLAFAPGGNGTSISLFLEGVQANLGIFEQSSGVSSLPMNLCPYWGNLPDSALVQSGMGLQQGGQTTTSMNAGTAMPNFGGQLDNAGLPISGYTIDSFGGITLPTFTGGITNP